MLLYVFDNDTNTVIRISIFVGLIIELWKIHKVVDVKVRGLEPSMYRKGIFELCSIPLYQREHLNGTKKFSLVF